MKNFTGTGVALITPFTDDSSVDEAALRHIVRFQLESGVDYLVVLGTTAENATLTKKEKELVKKVIVEENNEKLPLVLGIGGNNTTQVVADLQAENLDGFDAILSVSPYYNRPTQEGIYQHFKKISHASPLPIILYNVPGRTGSNVLPETVKRLALDCENIIGVKEAAGSIVQATQMIAATPKSFLVISGDDMLALPMVLAGGTGVISVMGQGFPAEFSQMIKHGLNRKVDEAYKIHHKLAPGIELIFEEGNPAGIKSVFEHMGMASSSVRLPLVEATTTLKKQLKIFIEKN